MKGFIKKLLRREFINENLLNENIKLLPYDEEGGFNDELEDYGIDPYEAGDVAFNIAKSNNMNILSDKNLRHILVDLNEKKVIGGVWTSEVNGVFSFDIAIDSQYQGKGLSELLIKRALDEYEYMNDIYYDMNDEKLDISVDVINPKLAKILQNHYNFKVKEKIGSDRIIMGLE